MWVSSSTVTNPGGPPRGETSQWPAALAVASMTIGLLAMNRADASSIDVRDLPAAPAPGLR